MACICICMLVLFKTEVGQHFVVNRNGVSSVDLHAANKIRCLRNKKLWFVFFEITQNSAATARFLFLGGFQMLLGVCDLVVTARYVVRMFSFVAKSGVFINETGMVEVHVAVHRKVKLELVAMDTDPGACRGFAIQVRFVACQA